MQVQQQGTNNQWLQWNGEQIAGVVQYIEAEDKAQMDRLLVTTDELETALSRIRSLEQDLMMAPEEFDRNRFISMYSATTEQSDYTQKKQK